MHYPEFNTARETAMITGNSDQFTTFLQAAVLLLFGIDKAKMGDVFYDSVGSRADQIIDQWIEQNEGKS